MALFLKHPVWTRIDFFLFPVTCLPRSPRPNFFCRSKIVRNLYRPGPLSTQTPGKSAFFLRRPPNPLMHSRSFWFFYEPLLPDFFPLSRFPPHPNRRQNSRGWFTIPHADLLSHTLPSPNADWCFPARSNMGNRENPLPPYHRPTLRGLP